MRNRALLLLTIFLISCGPSKGDKFKDPITHQEYTVLEVGQARKLIKLQKKAARLLVNSYMDNSDASDWQHDIKREHLISQGMCLQVVYLGLDSTKQAFSYNANIKGACVSIIRPIRDFNQ